MWGLPYLESKGLGLDTIKRFTELVQPMLIASMDEDDHALPPSYEAAVVDWLRHDVVSARSANSVRETA